VLQTFTPEHYAIESAARHDVEGFYARELGERRRLGYPPFARLARLEFRDRDSAKAEKEARGLAAKIQTGLAEDGRAQTTLIGPVPCFFSRLNSEYRWQIVLRGPDPAAILRGRIPKGWRVELEPVSLL
jgi:primosomal protein N' (replication factor Y)